MDVSEKQMLSEGSLSDLIDVPTRTLQDWRTDGKGPRFVKLGRIVRYRRSDIDTWLASLAPAGNVTPIESKRSA